MNWLWRSGSFCSIGPGLNGGRMAVTWYHSSRVYRSADRCGSSAALGYLVELILGERISPRSRGLVGFVTAAVVIYLAQFIIPTTSLFHYWEVCWLLLS